MSRHTHPKAGANAPCSPSPGLGSDDPQRAYSYPRPRDSGLIRPQAPGIQESVPSPLGSSCPSLLHLLVSFSRTFPACPQGPHLELNKCAFGFPPVLSVCCRLWAPEDWVGAEVAILSPPPPPGPPPLTTSFLPHLPQGVFPSLHPCPHLRPSKPRVEATALSPPPSSPSPAPTPACGAWKQERK